VQMKKQIELLAPGGDLDSIKAAIVAGADAVYCGLQRFNARNRAGNLSFEELDEVIEIGHGNNCAIYLTLNILIVETELPALVNLLNRVIKSGVDGIIVQDLGLLYLLKNYFPAVSVHASTQLTSHNSAQIHFLNRLGVKRINLCRELDVDEIKLLSAEAGRDGIVTEVFVHGAHCLSLSGICYMSSVLNGTSGNRGRCSQPCRYRFETTEQGRSFPLNLKDMSLFTGVSELVDGGVGSLKIEGRIKKFHYVFTVVKAWREQLKNYYENNEITVDDGALRSVFNRDFTDGYFRGNIGPEMFIDDNRDNSALSLINDGGALTGERLQEAKKMRYDRRTEIIQDVRDKISSLEKGPRQGRNSRVRTQFIPMDAPKICKQQREKVLPRLSVLLSSQEDIYLADQDYQASVDFYYKLPDDIEGSFEEIREIFSKATRLRPWFPAIQMENCLRKGVELLKVVLPECLITDNSGIAFEAQRLGIKWIAGPQCNITNSYSLKCLKEYFNCSGAFISNELKKNQINLITVPENFSLYYSIFHPSLLMTTKQCLFHGITGCEKKQIDEACLTGCEKSASLSTLNGKSILVEKSRGNYQRIFGQYHMLNTEIIRDINNMFTGICIDLSKIKTATDSTADKKLLISLFVELLHGESGAGKKLKEALSPFINCQYEQGL